VRLAALAVAAHVALGLWLTAAGGLPSLDRWAIDALDPLRDRDALEVVRVLTELGSFPFAALVTGIGALYASRTRGGADALLLGAALVALLFLVGLGKELWGRARPDGGFYVPDGLAYPSGHAAYAMAWPAVAWLTGRRGLILAAAGVTLAVGASRLYLHVHYATDVLGGFALGAAVFAPILARR
jgi:membrane-associated phospholipid phosphatase